MAADVHRISVAILAGGQSRRMGRDKALLDFMGRPMITHALGIASRLSDDVLIVASNRPEYERFGYRVVADRYDGAGALGGIYTALIESAERHCLVLGCDMPFVNEELLRYMVSLPRDYDALVPLGTSGDDTDGLESVVEPLHAIYAKAARVVIERRLRAGELKVAEAIAELRTRPLSIAEIRRFDPSLRSFSNLNTPRDVDRALSATAMDACEG